MNAVNFENAQETLAKERGFISWAEMCSLISSVPLMDSTDRERFTRWKEQDGTRAGLVRLRSELISRRR